MLAGQRFLPQASGTSEVPFCWTRTGGCHRAEGTDCWALGASLQLSSRCLESQGKRSPYGAIVAEIREEGATRGLLNWNFASPSLFESTLLWGRLPKTWHSVALEMLFTPASSCYGQWWPSVYLCPEPPGRWSPCLLLAGFHFGCHLMGRGNALGKVVAKIVLLHIQRATCPAKVMVASYILLIRLYRWQHRELGNRAPGLCCELFCFFFSSTQFDS